MVSRQAPDFARIADGETKRAFAGGQPETTEWLDPGTKLFKWTHSITSRKGVSPWWQLLESRKLTNGTNYPGLRELQRYPARMQVHDRDYARVRFAVTEQWNKMTKPVAIELVKGAWGYIGKAAGQKKNLNDPDVIFIGGGMQVWVPGLTIQDFRQTSILPYLTPNAPFGGR